jgi:CheY-like chemotaxis protein
VAKILLADDSGTAQRMGAQILSAEGHEVATVSNGQAAIKMLAKFAPDLIVADVFMPGKTGYELCEFVKSDPESSWIPVLLIVAPMEPYDATEGQRVKADGLVTKPLDKSNLVETVQALLASAKRPAPPSKTGGTKAAAVPKPEPPLEPAKMRELPEEEDLTIPAISTTTPVEIAIPEEMRNQPVSLVGELLEPESPPPELPVEEEFASERSSGDSFPLEIEPDNQVELEPASSFVAMPEAAPPIAAEAASSFGEMREPAPPTMEAEPAEQEPSGTDQLIAATAEASLDETPLPGEPETVISTVTNEELATPPVPLEPSPPAEPSWVADSAEVTKDDKELFGPEPPDWQGLVNLVREEDQQGIFPAASSSGGAQAPSANLSAASAPESPEPPSRSAQEEPEQEPEPDTSQNLAAQEEAPKEAGPVDAAPAVLNDTISSMVPQIAPLDYATVEQIVRETIEEVMPQIVDRIAQATGMRFSKKESSESQQG